MTGQDVQATFAAVLVDEWARSGVTDAVVAPGSRSTPLVVALAAGPLRIHVVLDERSAGFFGLGLGLNGRPALVVTTSGTAAVELHPAVVEAHQAGVPLIVVTADRPAEAHDIGAPQTVEQEGLYGGAVRWAASPGVADMASSSSWRSLASRLFAESLFGPSGPGPVHLNLAFREPLLGRPFELPQGRPGGHPWHSVSAGESMPPEDVVERLAALGGHRGLIVAGAGLGAAAAAAPGQGAAVLNPDGSAAGGGGADRGGAVGDGAAAAAVQAMATALGWPMLADARSGCRVPGQLTVAAADALLRVPELAAWQPDVVVRVGRPWASRVLSGWLDQLDPAVEQVLVDPFGQWPDPERSATTVLQCPAAALGQAVVDRLRARSAPVGDDRWARQWALVESMAQRTIDRVLDDHPELTEPGVARSVIDALPSGATLFVSSSMPVRDVEWWGRPRYGLRVLANRGANGIDGIVSTALGIAASGPGPVVALVGDLAFLYDVSALLWAADRGVDCTLVVVDNNGGGIFSFLPQATTLAQTTFERLWGTPHGIDLGRVAGAYGVPVASAETSSQVGPAVRASLDAGGVRVVHLRTDRRANVALHAELTAAVTLATEGLLKRM